MNTLNTPAALKLKGNLRIVESFTSEYLLLKRIWALKQEGIHCFNTVYNSEHDIKLGYWMRSTTNNKETS